MSKFGHDFFGPIPIEELMKKETVTIYPDDYPSNEGLCSDGIYGWVRHPMQAGFVLMFGFGSNYTVDRLLYFGTTLFWQVVSIYYEEKRLEKKFKGYAAYKNKVKYMLIPYVIW